MSAGNHDQKRFFDADGVQVPILPACPDHPDGYCFGRPAGL
jgi:hypothetical protein